ncbi:hypothetical protein K439DRAFT_1628831 [Ramaria rubella]|nr:hypothetical protein K439DRAFT_1628831 [Ramaria rubella]
MDDVTEVQEASYVFLGMCGNYGVLAMFVYDYYLTIPDEVQLIWQRPFRLSTALYFMIRFLPFPQIIFNFPISLPLLPWSPVKCQQLYRLTAILANIARSGFIAVLVLRTYAVYERNVKILIGLGSLGVAVVGSDFVSIAASTCLFAPATLLQRLSQTIATALRVAFEIILIVFTIWRTAYISQRRKTRIVLEGASLESLILRSGLLSFVPGLLLETIALISLYVDGITLSTMNTFSLPLSAIIIAHFLLDIRSYADHPHQTATLSIFRADPPTRALTNFGQEFGDELLGGYRPDMSEDFP